MRILKAVIIGMAVLIVLGMGLLVYGLTLRSVNGNVADDTTLPFEDGCDIADMAIEDGRLYIRSGPSGDCSRVYVLDAETGTLIGTVRAAP
jgi:outer membrane protein assembly factor BamB